VCSRESSALVAFQPPLPEHEEGVYRRAMLLLVCVDMPCHRNRCGSRSIQASSHPFQHNLRCPPRLAVQCSAMHCGSALADTTHFALLSDRSTGVRSTPHPVSGSAASIMPALPDARPDRCLSPPHG
jgi:hypothetical protein